MKDIKNLLDKLPEADVQELNKCEKCGRKIFKIDGTEVGCECDLIKQMQSDIQKQKAKAFADQSIITEYYKSKRLRDYERNSEDQMKAFQLAKDYIINFDDYRKKGTSLIIQGSPGTGKTHIAASIRNALVERNYKVYFITLPEYLDEIKAAFNEPNKRYTIDRMVRESDLLIVDDVGANRMTDFAIEEFFKLVDARVGKCTIYTTNQTAEEFNKTRDLKRVFSRMMNESKIVPLNGQDYRMERSHDN